MQWLLAFVIPRLAPDAEVFGMPMGPLGFITGVLIGLVIVLWWLFFSRAPWLDRIGAIVLMIAAVVLTKLVVHESIAGASMGMMLYIFPIPFLCLALVGWAAATRRLSDGARRAALVGTMVLASVPWTLLRTAGVGSGGYEFHWRWSQTPEQQLLARAADEPKPRPPSTAPPVDVPKAVAEPKEPVAAKVTAAPPPAPPAASTPIANAAESSAPAAPPAAAKSADWPGFRGPNRDSIVRGVRIATDWSASPPVQMWRRPIGPGWSSFAVAGDLLYTQEQRGEDEIVACYRVSTGEPVWRHRDPVRFWESNAGAGPRATPTLSQGRVYSFGATGLLNALDARSGARIWSRNVATDTRRQVPIWGFSSSPLVVDDVVIVAAAGTLAGYDVATGNLRWRGPSYGGSYSSPHRATLDGVVQILLLGGPGAISVAPADGAVLWEHAWSPGAIVQPALTADGDILVNAIASTGGIGTRRLAVSHGTGKWTVAERWTSNGLKPYFNDFVVHKGHAYGFDGTILSCIDLTDGSRKWKGGRYGNGQLVLLEDQDVLLVLSEDGELALVAATPDRYRELGKVPAIDGKTWNHPVLVGDRLLVRNDQEMAAFRLSPASR
jgi:outer membrane protein assembly factor BamB